MFSTMKELKYLKVLKYCQTLIDDEYESGTIAS